MVAGVLSGNRNFEGRIHPYIKANYLASPPLVVAYALAGTADIDLTTEPLGTGRGCCTEVGTVAFHLGEDFWQVHWIFGCPGGTDDTKVFLRVRAYDGAPADTCEPYLVEYHY